MLTDLARDPALSRFRTEYEKLYHVLRKSHGARWCEPGRPNHTAPPGNEQQLLATCRQLNAEIVSNVAKVQTALHLSEEDQATIVALKRELEKSWKALDAAIEKVWRLHCSFYMRMYHCAHPTGGWP